jgi:hypothetical protein
VAIKRAWDVDGYFKISYLPDGVFLTVYPPIGLGEKVDPEEVIAQIKDEDIKDVDFDKVYAIVEESAGAPIKIAETQAERVENLLMIELTEDELHAYMTIIPPVGGGASLSIQDIKEELKKGKIVFGVDEERIIEALKNDEFNTPILIAKGIPPSPGKDAVLEYRFKKEKKETKSETVDGKIDFRERDLIENVEQGDVLVKKIPATKGVPGKTVTGKEIFAEDGEDVPLPVGKNTEESPDGLELRATISGQVIVGPGRIDVEPVYYIKGDVSYSTGNIDFAGSVIIEGSILDGFSVKADRNVEVKGSIEKAMVEVGGDLIVQNGILGKDEGFIKCSGNIIAKFIEHANIECDGDVIVGEAIVHSNIDAKKRVIVNGKRGIVLGGKIRTGMEVNSKTLGSLAEIPTEIEVGVDPKIREEIQRLSKEIEEDKKNFNELKLGIRTLLSLKEKMGGRLPPEKEELLVHHLRAQNLLMEKLKDATEKVNHFQRELSKEKGGKICVANVVYPGVKLSIRTVTLHVREEYKFVTFTVKGGSMEIRPYEEPKLTKKELDMLKG